MVEELCEHPVTEWVSQAPTAEVRMVQEAKNPVGVQIVPGIFELDVLRLKGSVKQHVVNIKRHLHSPPKIEQEYSDAESGSSFPR